MDYPKLLKYLFWRRQYSARNPEVVALYAQKEKARELYPTARWFEEAWSMNVDGFDAEIRDFICPEHIHDGPDFPRKTAQVLRSKGFMLCQPIDSTAILKAYLAGDDYTQLDLTLWQEDKRDVLLNSISRRFCGLLPICDLAKDNELEVHVDPSKPAEVTAQAVKLLIERFQAGDDYEDHQPIYEDSSLHKIVARHVRSKAHFRPGRSEEGRICGLALWDMVNGPSSTTSVAEAFKTLSEEYPGAGSGVADAGRAANLITHIQACIDQGEVLAMP